MKNPPNNLPPPDKDAAQHSACVVEQLCNAMRTAGGAIPFARFMELCLYAPGLGYYSAGSRKFGAAGDFITAPEISPLFSRTLAHQYRAVLDELEGGEILEIGAGSGRMAADSLAELERLEALPQRYRILELSGELRQRQHETIERDLPHLVERVEWLDTLPEAGFRGVIVGNEVMDALPVERFRIAAEGLKARHVRQQGHSFAWQDNELSPSLRAAIEALPEHLRAQWPRGYESETCLALAPWIATLAATLDAGLLLLIDYGFPRHEYYHPDRNGGTLMCHYRHRAHTDPLILAGLQDITAHVDFTAVAEAAHGAGLTVAGYTTQAYFLLGAGINALLDAPDLGMEERFILAQGIKKLLLPSEMGELFKVIGLTRNLGAQPLAGFAMNDLRHKL